MSNITITTAVTESDDIAAALRVIAQQIEAGFTSGYYPTWVLSN